MSNELYHHGILGQKWGKQNGPPYPLDPQKDYSAEEKRLAKRISKNIKKDLNLNSYIRQNRKEADDTIKFRQSQIAKDYRDKYKIDELSKQRSEAHKEFRRLVRESGLEDEDQLNSENTNPKIERAWSKYEEAESKYYSATSDMAKDFISTYSNINLEKARFNNEYELREIMDYYTNPNETYTKYANFKLRTSRNIEAYKSYADYKKELLKFNVYDKLDDINEKLRR